MDKTTCLIYCNCGGNIISDEESDQLTKRISEFGIDVFELHDLCAIALNEKKLLNSLFKEYDHKVIIACFPRAIKNLFRQNKIEIDNYTVINVREHTVIQIIEKLINDFNIPKGIAVYKKIKSQLNVPAWYPVIDTLRCTLCGDCFHFCLFGVYQLNNGGLDVVNPLACKNNCPACGRNCINSAIIFPKLKEKTYLSGAEPVEKFDSSTSENNNDFLNKLKERNRNRNSIFRQGLVQQAEQERKNAIQEQVEQNEHIEKEKQ